MLRQKLRGGVEVVKSYDTSIPRIWAYGSELNQVWTNLIDNAVDAMDGHGVLTLRTRPVGEGLVVEVSDTGKGIPADIIDRIYEPFFTTKRQGNGTGLGL